MASGKQLADRNFELFKTWLCSKSDQDLVQLVSRGVLSRVEIAKECGFAKSVLDQNPRVKNMLALKEKSMRDAGLLPQKNKDNTVIIKEPTLTKKEIARMGELENENASLRAEVGYLREELLRINLELTQLKAISDVLAETGRVPY